MNTCLTEEAVAKYVAGTCTPDEGQAVEGHLSTCESCRQRIERARADEAFLEDFQAMEARQRQPADGPNGAGEGGTRPIRLAETPSMFDASVPEVKIEGYEIVRELHRGGQGVVYQAIQARTRRKVAIKVMKEGPFAGKRDKARFEREVKILAAMKHPNIVGIHDSGVAAGRFYYVMDYISGRALDDQAAFAKPSIKETCRLFVKICEAVNAAHLRGVIHRDLKPSNIRIDAEGEPHVLDFGLAKMATTEVTDGSRPEVMSVTGQFIGSMPWASPEQAEAIPAKIDIRTDVYSLGVILYQMLTGRFPYEVVGHMRDVQDNILNAEPAKPSTIRRQIDDEVETIVLKSLSKERERRYQSAGELARDIHRYLAGEPIEAKRDSGLYVLRKTLGRYKIPVGVGAAFVVLVSVSLVVSITAWRQAARERDRARLAERQAQGNRELAERARGMAEGEKVRAEQASKKAGTEAKKAEQINNFLQDMLASADPDNTKGADVTVLQMLDEAGKKVETALSDQPEVEAAIRRTIGETYITLGQHEIAEKHLRTALAIQRRTLGNEHVDVSITLYDLALAVRSYNEAIALLTESFEIRRKILGENHPLTIHARGELSHWKRIGGLGKAGDDMALDSLVGFYKGRKTKDQIRKEFEQVAANVRRSWAAGEKEKAHRQMNEASSEFMSIPFYKTLVPNAARAYAERQWELGDYDLAEALLCWAVNKGREVFGKDTKEEAIALGVLAGVLKDQHKYVEAESHSREAHRIFSKILPKNSNRTLLSKIELSLVLTELSKYDEAERLSRETLEIYRKTLPEGDPGITGSLVLLGTILTERGDPGGAEALLREALEIRQKQLPEGDWLIASARSALGSCLSALGQYKQAEPLLVESYPIIKAALGEADVRSRDALDRIIHLYEAWKKPDKVAEYQAMLPTRTGEAAPQGRLKGKRQELKPTTRSVRDADSRTRTRAPTTP